MDERPVARRRGQPFVFVLGSLVIAALWALFLTGPDRSLWTRPEAPIIGTLLVLSVFLEVAIWARRR